MTESVTKFVTKIVTKFIRKTGKKIIFRGKNSLQKSKKKQAKTLDSKPLKA